MGGVRACAFVLVTLLSFQLVAGKPFLDALWCYLICDDDDSGTGSYEDIFDYDMCDCGPKAATTKAPVAAAALPQSGPFSMMIPPSNGMNLTMINTGTGWVMSVVPYAGAPGGQAAPAPGTPAAPAAGAPPAPTAGAPPAPAAGAPPAPAAAAAPPAAGATPAPAAGATTVAPTTAAAGK